MSDDLDRQARQLSDAWDQLLAGETVADGTGQPELVGTLRDILAINQRDVIDQQVQGEIWANVIAGTAELWRPNGADVAPPAAARNTSRLALYLMRFAWVVAAGFAGGFVAGIASRLAMRVAAILTIDRNRFLLTENGNQVGEITAGGTVFLGLVAAAAGIATVFLYLLLRSRLPFTGWRRSAVFSVLLLLVFGFVLMDPSNPDYHRFGPAWLNVSMFSSLYLFMGFFTSWFYELVRAHRLPERALSARSAVRIPLQVTSAIIGVFGLFVSGGVAILGIHSALIVIALGLLAWLGNRYIVETGHLRRLSLPAVVQPLGLLVVPGLAGLVLTARNITEILLN
jgi:hypothetical protein